MQDSIVAGAGESGDANLLLEAFRIFTEASTSLESAFDQLRVRTQRLSRELEAKNCELEENLREKEEVQNYLRTILSSLPCGVLVLDERDRIALCNPVAAEILECPQSEAIHGRRRTLRGTVLEKYFVSSRAGEASSPDEEISVARGGRVRTIATSTSPLTGPSGQRIGTLHILRDVTELKSLEEQSKRVERLSAMGEMAVELAHEIRNPLGSIELFASLLEKELPAGSEMGRWAEHIRIGSRSLNNIVSNMLQFTNPLHPRFDAVDMHGVAEETLRFTEPITRQRGVTVEKHLEAAEACVLGDRELLKQVILNLILNSLQAMPSRGSLCLSTRNVGQSPGGTMAEGLEFRVRDTGLGIPPENIGRIFDPFFTTNKNGTGLGLSVVHQIVDRHAGYIRVESEVNRGSTFIVFLPAARTVSGAA